ncbi:recombinase family protein [Mediterraneibacter faecis]|uniref:recombinase family protein n=1 Tax=Mediterraneibacter faecis TaxID=592978 RepID=UPI003CF9F09C
MAKISRIEPKIPALKKRQKVAAYARVSMETDRLAHSLSAQVSYYNGLIQSNPEWEYAGVYADFGISGTGTAARSEFLRLIADCEAGKVDIVLTKSISRFARNTVDLLSTIRHLKEIGVEVRFEKERIHSFSGDGELMLSILASFAQEESRSISENSKWGIRKRYQSGEIGVKNKRVFGYSYDGGKYEIVPEEAEAVRLIFERFTSGVPLGEIKSELEEAGIKSWRGYNLSYSHLNYILRNEIYIGDRRYQKCFIEDPIRKNKIKNQGQLPQYYVENDHTAIISREVFDKAQDEIIRRAALVNPAYPFTGKIKCGICGCHYTRRSATVKGREYVSWFCRAKKEKGVTCRSHNYSEEQLQRICAGLMGMEEFDAEAFGESVRGLTVLADGSLEAAFLDGQTKVWEASPEPVKPPKPDKPARKRPKNIFDGKIFCETCGRRFGRAVSQTADGGHLYWYCRAKSSHGVTCDSVNYPDSEIKEIFCKVMGQDEFNEGFFEETLERMVVQRTGSIDFHLKGGTVRTHKALKLRGSRHENTSTEEFAGKIRCASCGNLYHKYCCYGKYTYWRCSGKSRVRTECSGRDFQDSDIRKISAYLMGMEEFDGAEFEKQVQELVALEDGSLECHFYGGKVRKWQRT